MTERTISAEMLFCCALLHMVTRLAMALKLDPDGSLTPQRVEAAVGTFEQISHGLADPGAPWDAAAGPTRATLQAELRRLAPLMSRLAAASSLDA